MATSPYITVDSLSAALDTSAIGISTINNNYATLVDSYQVGTSYWTTHEKEIYFNDKFLESCIKAVDKGIITTEQAFNLLRMLKSNDEESKELAKAILENAEAK